VVELAPEALVALQWLVFQVFQTRRPTERSDD
jgi:hypothetical protein